MDAQAPNAVFGEYVRAGHFLPDTRTVRAEVRYGELAEYLTAHGYVVCGHDHLGHGESLGEDGMRGYFAHRDGDRLLVEDTKKLNKVVDKALSKGNIKFIEVVDVQIEEQLYGITLEDFLEKAVRLDPKTRKPIEVTTNE